MSDLLSGMFFFIRTRKATSTKAVKAFYFYSRGFCVAVCTPHPPAGMPWLAIGTVWISQTRSVGPGESRLCQSRLIAGEKAKGNASASIKQSLQIISFYRMLEETYKKRLSFFKVKQLDAPCVRIDALRDRYLCAFIFSVSLQLQAVKVNRAVLCTKKPTNLWSGNFPVGSQDPEFPLQVLQRPSCAYMP